jgi:hypothetical protein
VSKRPRDFNPFYAGSIDGHDAYWVDAENRLDRVKGFSIQQCRNALLQPGLQKIVIRAIERRLKSLQSLTEAK